MVVLKASWVMEFQQMLLYRLMIKLGGGAVTHNSVSLEADSPWSWLTNCGPEHQIKTTFIVLLTFEYWTIKHYTSFDIMSYLRLFFENSFQIK